MSSNQLGVSVIVCCYNSAIRLPQTLKYLSKQETIPNAPFEIILVNNASTDNTTEVAKKEWLEHKAPFSLRIINEQKAGLSYARERGVYEAKYEYIVFCDDDNWLSSNYLYDAFIIMTNNPQVGVLGGRSEAASDVPLPFWFYTYQESFAVGVQALNSGDVTQRNYLWGAGMVFRKSIYLSLLAQGFHPLLSDRNGKNLTSGGDSEICYWFLLGGFRLWYDEKLLFKHFIPNERLSKAYLVKLFSSFEQSKEILVYYAAVLLKKQLNLNFSKFIFHAIKFIIFRRHTDRVYAEAFSIFPFPLFSAVTYKIRKAAYAKVEKSNELMQVNQN